MDQMRPQGIRELVFTADFGEAVHQLKEQYSKNSALKSSPQFYTLMGILEGITSNKKASLRYFQKAKGLYGSSSTLFLDMMAIRFSVFFQEDSTANKLFNAFVEENPQSSLGWGERGAFLYHQGKHGPAIESLDIALDLNDRNILARGYKALAGEEIGSAKADEDYRKFVITEPSDALGSLSKAEIYDNKDDFERSRAYITQVLAEDPGNLAAIYLKRASLIHEGKRTLLKKFDRKLDYMGFRLEALDLLQKNRFYVLGKILFFLGQTNIFQELGDLPVSGGVGIPGRASVREEELAPRPAMKAGGRARSLDGGAGAASRQNYQAANEPRFKMADKHFAKGKMEMQRKNHEAAIKYFEQAVSYNPDHTEALNEIGLIYMITGDDRGYRIDQAIKYFDRIILQAPNFSLAHYNKFVAFLLVGNYESALESIDMAIAVEPGNIQYLLDKGVLLGDIKRCDYAVEVLEEVIRKDPDNATAWGRLAFVYKELGNKKNEVRCLNHFLKLEPTEDRLVRAGHGLQTLCQVRYRHQVFRQDPLPREGPLPCPEGEGHVSAAHGKETRGRCGARTGQSEPEPLSPGRPGGRCQGSGPFHGWKATRIKNGDANCFSIQRRW